MLRLYRVLFSFLVVLLSFSETQSHGIVSNEPDDLFSQSIALDGDFENYFVKSVDGDHHIYKIHVKKKAKIRVRGRARYCIYQLLPAPLIVQEFPRVSDITYVNREFFIYDKSHFTFKLRGPPVQLFI